MNKSTKSQIDHRPPKVTNLIGFWLTVIFSVATIILFITAWQQGYFRDEQKMANFINRFGIWGPLAYGIFQAFQVIIPLIPGGVTVPAGVLMLRIKKATVISSISIIIASIAAFMLARRYGWQLISNVTTRDQYETAREWLKNIEKDQPIKKQSSPVIKRMKHLVQRLNDNRVGLNTLVIITMTVPGFPADLLCYIFGLTKVRTKDFMIIMLIVKPINLLLYGFLLASPVQMLQ